jgi:hydroxypyruvate isomerase
MATLNRREALLTGALGAAGTVLAPRLAGAVTPDEAIDQKVVKNGRLTQSVCRWPYNKIPMPEFCKAVSDIGLTAIDLLGPADWEGLRQYGLICSMGSVGAGSIPNGFNNKGNHDAILKALSDKIPLAAKHGVPNVITFFGNVQPGMTEAEAIDNCVAGLNRAKTIAEDHGVTICVELLNSKVNHKGYQGDHSAFGLQIVRAVGSPRVKLLYDIYHMQIMEGDVISTIRQNIAEFAHFHTGGVPGRHELDDTQELNWPAVCRAIVDAGFKGYVAHEFVPARDPLTSLREAASLCDV